MESAKTDKSTRTSVEVPSEKAEYLREISTMNVETLKILAAKSKKPGIEQKLKNWQHLI